MTTTQRNMLIAAGALFVLALVVFVYTRFFRTTVPVTPIMETPVQSSTTPEGEMQIPLTPVTPAQTVEAQKNRNMTAFAMQFTERYGSYSTESNFQNLRDLLPSMTDAMQRRSEATIAAGVAPGTEFYGVTTQSLAVKVDSSNAVTATVMVSARRTETKGTVTTSFNQEARLQLLKTGDNWLVESLEWLQKS